MSIPFESRTEAENNCFIFSPEYQQRLLANKKAYNYGLYFQKMCHWRKTGKESNELTLDTGIEEFKIDNYKKKKETVRQNYLTHFHEASKVFSNYETKNALKRVHTLQTQFINSVQGYTITAKSTSPFITGLGSGHPTETGMILDRNTGLPYIPASTIKGVCKLAYAIILAKNGKADNNGNVPDSELESYFGTQDEKAEIKKRGQIVFLDAFPTEVPELKEDIINPHFQAYYSGNNKQPAETESPVPIKFLTVKQYTAFSFRWVYLPLDNRQLTEEEKAQVKADADAFFKTAFTTVGFGGKTSIGYGRFKEIGNE